MEVQPIKASYNGDIRRFRMEKKEVMLEDLQKALVDLYKPEFTCFDILYKDPDGDLIRVTCESELQEAFLVMKEEGHGLVRLEVGEHGSEVKAKDDEDVGAQTYAKSASIPATDVAGTGTAKTPSFVEIFAAIPPESFLHFFPGGKFMQPILKSFSNISAPVKESFVVAAKGISESGQLEDFTLMIPKVLEVLRTFTEKNLSSESTLEKEIDAEAVSDLCVNLTGTLEHRIGGPNTKQIVESVRLGLAEKPFRRLLLISLRRFQWATQGDSFRLNKKPWTKDIAYNGETVPVAPLKQGDSGAKVMHLQNCLIQVGQMSPENVCWRVGAYGPRTAAAIKSIQVENQIEAGTLGVYNKATEAKLKELVEKASDEKALKATPMAADISAIFWLISSFTPFLGGFHQKGPAMRKQKPGPWMLGGMPFGPHMMEKLHAVLLSMSEETREAIDAAANSVWMNGQMPAVYSCGPFVFNQLRNFVSENLGRDANPEEVISAEKIEALKTTLKDKLSAAEVPEETYEKILVAVEKAFGEVSVRSNLKNFHQKRMAFEQGVLQKLKRRPWEKESDYANEMTPNAPLNPGDTGVKVMHLQSVLMELGKMSVANVQNRVGFYGDNTTSAVKNFQKRSNLLEKVEAVGSYDSLTASTLASVLEKKRNTIALASNQSASGQTTILAI